MNNLRLVNLTPDLLCISHFDGQFIFTNPAFEKVLGYSADEIVNINVFSIIHPDDRDVINNSLMSARKDNKDSIILEYRYMCKDGVYKWIHWNVKIVWEEQLVFVAGHDITSIKNMLLQLIKTKDELEETNAQLKNATVAKSQFLANMSHEIRTPINAIMGFLDLLYTSNPSFEQKEFIRNAKSASKVLLYLINDILDFSKIEAGKLKMES